jgi:hypothetical protein
MSDTFFPAVDPNYVIILRTDRDITKARMLLRRKTTTLKEIGDPLTRVSELRELLRRRRSELEADREYAVRTFLERLVDMFCTLYKPIAIFASTEYYPGEWADYSPDEYGTIENIDICEDCGQVTYVVLTNERRHLCETCLNIRATDSVRTEYVLERVGITKTVDSARRSMLMDMLKTALLFSIFEDYESLESFLERWIREKPELIRKKAISILATMSIQSILGCKHKRDAHEIELIAKELEKLWPEAASPLELKQTGNHTLCADIERLKL